MYSQDYWDLVRDRFVFDGNELKKPIKFRIAEPIWPKENYLNRGNYVKYY